MEIYGYRDLGSSQWDLLKLFITLGNSKRAGLAVCHSTYLSFFPRWRLTNIKWYLNSVIIPQQIYLYHKINRILYSKTTTNNIVFIEVVTYCCARKCWLTGSVVCELISFSETQYNYQLTTRQWAFTRFPPNYLGGCSAWVQYIWETKQSCAIRGSGMGISKAPFFHFSIGNISAF